MAANSLRAVVAIVRPATSASRYQPSAWPYHGLEELEYPHHVFAGQKVGVKQTEDPLWRSVRTCYPCLRNGPRQGWRARQDSNLRPSA